MTATESTEQRILAAAAEVFLQKGKDGARMHEIARKAGINQALLHYYFRNKERLYEEVFTQKLSQFFGDFFASLSEIEDIRQLIRSFIDHYLDRLTEQPDLPRFIFWEIRQGGSVFAKVLRKYLGRKKEIQNPFVLKVQEAVSAGQIRPLDPMHMFLSLLGMCLIPFIARPILERVLPDFPGLSAEFLETRKREIFDLVWQGIRPEEK